ncbi:MAG: LamG-like jellyroll fold domain-containing protein, partial [Lentisphaeria bacterium]
MKQIRVIKGLLLLLLSTHIGFALANESGSSNSPGTFSNSGLTRASALEVEFTQNITLSDFISGGVVQVAPIVTLKLDGGGISQEVIVSIEKDPSDNRNWHTSNATEQGNTSSFTFEKLGFINSSAEDVADPIVCFVVKDIDGVLLGTSTPITVTGNIKASYSVVDPIRSVNFNSDNDYMSLGAMPQIGADDMKAFTFETWIKVTGKDNDRYIFQYGDQSEVNSQKYLSVRVLNGANGTVRTTMHDGETSNSTWLYSHNNNAPYYDYGVWTHFAVSFDLEKQQLTLFKNGKEVEKVTTFNRHTSFPSNAGEFRIARGKDSGALWAEYDEIRIWKKALTEEDLKKYIYRPIEKPSEEQDLIGYYRCDAIVGVNNET